MNNFTVTGTLTSNPQLRFTASDQTPVCDALISFQTSNGEEHLGITLWGNLGKEFAEQFAEGNILIFEGRLSIESVTVNEVKQRRAKLTASRVYALTATEQPQAEPQQQPAAPKATTKAKSAKTAPKATVKQPVAAAAGGGEYDHIPF